MSENPPPLPAIAPEKSARNQRGKTLLLVWLGLIFGSLLLGVVLDRAMAASVFPPCGFKALTGLSCPGCGGTRSTAALLSFDFFEAVKFHPVWVLTLAYLAFVLCAESILFLKRKPAKSWFPAKVLWIWLGAIVLMTVLRNIPGLESFRP